MARKRYVTRTIKGERLDVMCMDMTIAEPVNRSYVITGHCKTDEERMKILRKEHETDDFKIVAIVGVEQVEHLYGLDENKFLEYAEIMPARKSN